MAGVRCLFFKAVFLDTLVEEKALLSAEITASSAVCESAVKLERIKIKAKLCSNAERLDGIHWYICCSPGYLSSIKYE